MYFFLAPWPACVTLLNFVTVAVSEGHQMWGPSLCTSLSLAHCSQQPSSSFNRNLKFKFLSNLTRITGTLQEETCTFTIISRSILLGMRNVSDKSCIENQNTHFTCNNFFFRKWCHYEIMWKNIVEPRRPQITIWRMRIACWVTKATDTPSQYIMLIAFPTQQWLHERVSVLRYT